MAKPNRGGRNPVRGLIAVCVSLVFAAGSSAAAQTHPARSSTVRHSSLLERIDTPRPLAAALAVRAHEPSLLTRTPRTPVPQDAGRRERSIGRKILGASLGAAGGFFGGGFLGAKIEGSGCHCDDPGLKGALIGAPIGAVTGGILGFNFL
ncbi:MAG: hypothetical protein AB7F99_09745 [Vicinamibacterales bacterium]